MMTTKQINDINRAMDETPTLEQTLAAIREITVNGGGHRGIMSERAQLHADARKARAYLHSVGALVSN